MIFAVFSILVHELILCRTELIWMTFAFAPLTENLPFLSTSSLSFNFPNHCCSPLVWRTASETTSNLTLNKSGRFLLMKTKNLLNILFISSSAVSRLNLINLAPIKKKFNIKDFSKMMSRTCKTPIIKTEKLVLFILQLYMDV